MTESTNDPSSSLPTMELRLTGQRFEDHGIPLEVLKDLAALEELLLGLARDEYRRANSSRRRIPRGFDEGVSLTLMSISPGSAIPQIRARYDGADLFPPEVTDYFSRAWRTLAAAVADAASEKPGFGILPEKLLGYFNRFGRSLKVGEGIEFLGTNHAHIPCLTTESRRKLLLASSTIRTYSEEIVLCGTVPEVDQEGSFELQLFDQRRIKAPLQPEHADTILSAFNGYKVGARIRLRGVGEKSRNGRLLTIETVDQATLLDPLDVPARLDEFRLLKDGWLDGGGSAPDAEGLNWLAAEFAAHYPDALPLPYTYPTEEGGIQFEWPLGSWEASLEIHLTTKMAEWHACNLASGESTEAQLNLTEPAGWHVLGELLEALSPGDNQ